jgi:hypothetical protein
MKDIYRFRIDAFTPETIPMERLAEYMGELARLFGNVDKVHFLKLKRGSAVLETEVESVAVPKVRQRLTQMDAVAPGDDVTMSFRKLNLMLACDNAVGKLRRGTAVILDFPGRTTPTVKFGPVTQASTVQGQLVRIGGRDKTAHGLIEDVTGRAWRIVTTRDEARALAQLIYGPTIRATGMGRWVRDDDGHWELEELRLQAWEQVAEQTLRDGIEHIRRIETPEWLTDNDPVGTLARIRDGEDQVH